MNVPAGDATVTLLFDISAQHPSLPGHFPGHPIVPGVVLLDRIAAALELAGLPPLRRIHAVKFLTPLLPGQVAQLTATRDGTRLRFRIERDGIAIVSGEAETGVGNE